jgi:hypothetical protein
MIPFLEWIQFTTRGVGSAFFSIEFMLRNSVQLQHLLTPILPLLWFDSESSTSIYLGLPSNLREISSFVGLISLCLIVLGLFRVKNQNKHLVIYFLGLAFFGLIMSMGTTKQTPGHLFPGLGVLWADYEHGNNQSDVPHDS